MRAAPVLWALGTFGRVAVFSAIMTGMIGFEFWTAAQSPDGGASFSFLLIGPLEFAIAGIWGAVDGWRRLTWTAILVRWIIVALVSGLTVTGFQFSASNESPDLNLLVLLGLLGAPLLQAVVIVGGAATGASVMKK